MSNSTAKDIYDKYCSMLNGLALQICYFNKKAAEELLISTFKKIWIGYKSGKIPSLLHNSYTTYYKDCTGTSPTKV